MQRHQAVWFWQVILVVVGLIYVFKLGQASGTNPDALVVLNLLATGVVLYGLYCLVMAARIIHPLMRVLVEVSCLYVGGYNLLALLGYLWRLTMNELHHPPLLALVSAVTFLLLATASVGGFLALLEA